MSEFIIGQYAAYVKQSGEGCDYMIGCGNTMIPLTAETLADAWDEIADHMVGGYGYPNGDIGLDHVVIVRVKDHKTGDEFEDLAVPDDEEEPEEDPAKRARREQYEKLKREFER